MPRKLEVSYESGLSLLSLPLSQAIFKLGPRAPANVSPLTSCWGGSLGAPASFLSPQSPVSPPALPRQPPSPTQSLPMAPWYPQDSHLPSHGPHSLPTHETPCFALSLLKTHLQGLKMHVSSSHSGLCTRCLLSSSHNLDNLLNSTQGSSSPCKPHRLTVWVSTPSDHSGLLPSGGWSYRSLPLDLVFVRAGSLFMAKGTQPLREYK